MIRQWFKKYIAFGKTALCDETHNNSYSSELKMKAVKAYIKGEASQDEICLKYEICSTSNFKKMGKEIMPI